MLTLLLRMIPWSARSDIKRIPGIAELQRYAFNTFMSGRIFTHQVDAGPAKGLRFRIKLPEDKGIWTGTYETSLATMLASYIRRGDVAYDIGGWHGFFAGVMAAHGAGQVHVFEPLPANARSIEAMIELNPDRAIYLHTCALGAADCDTDLFVMPETSMAKITESGFQTENRSASVLRIPMRTVDSLVANGDAPPPALIKLDVEGAEALVLRGAQQTLRSHHPMIFAEVHSPELLVECREILEEAGYRISYLEDGSANRSSSVVHIMAQADT